MRKPVTYALATYRPDLGPGDALVELARAISSTAASLVDLTPCIFMTNSSTFVAQRRASSVEIIFFSQSRKSDWSNVCMPYCDVPSEIASRMRCVLLASTMLERVTAKSAQAGDAVRHIDLQVVSARVTNVGREGGGHGGRPVSFRQAGAAGCRRELTAQPEHRDASDLQVQV